MAMAVMVVVSASLATAYAVGLAPPLSPLVNNNSKDNLALPTCGCDNDNKNNNNNNNNNNNTLPLSPQQQDLILQLQQIVGSTNVLSCHSNKQKYEKGMRLGHGTALCVVTPHLLQEVIDCIPLIINANCTILVQGANTGLTGASVPRFENHNNNDDDDDDDHHHRPTVIISTLYLDTIFPIDDGQRVVCLAGAGLASLVRFLQHYFPQRESHSTLGSTFLNPTTAAGVALGSGGTECCRKGSAYTNRALYVCTYKDKWGDLQVQVVNTLGIAGIEDDDFYTFGRTSNGNVISQLDQYCRDVRQGYQRSMAKSSCSNHGKASASDASYAQQLCVLDDHVSRFNADTRGCDCNRSEGKLLILATVHDTFPKPVTTKSFWLSFDSLETALDFRRQVCLDNAKDLPVSLEYMDRDSFDVINQAGRVLAGIIKLVGPSSTVIKSLWSIKQWVEGLPLESAPYICDKFLYNINNWIPASLPAPIMKMGKDRNHHVAMTVGEYGDGSMKRLLDRMHKFASKNGRDKIEIYECQSPSEADSLTAFRFVAAPAFKTWCVGNDVQGFSVDYALPKNAGEAPPLDSQPLKRMRYSHFACNVVHEDLAYPRNADAMQAKMNLKQTVEQKCRGKLPAEHGHGTEYTAPPETQERWKRMDPLNVMNPGIGGLSALPEYKDKEKP